MSVETAARRAFTFGRQRHTGAIGKRDSGELALLGAGLAGSVLLPFFMPVLALKVLAVLLPAGLALAAVFAPYRPRGSRAPRRTFYRWWGPSRAYRRALKAGPWRSDAHEAGIHLNGTEPQIGPPPGVSRHTWLSTQVTVNGIRQPAAVLLHTDRRVLTAAVEVEPSGLNRLDEADQAVLLDLFGRSVLNHLGNGPGYCKRIAMVARQLKSDPYAHARDIAARGDATAAAWLRESYAELHEQLSTSAEQHRFFAVLSIDYTPDLAAEAETFGGGDTGLGYVVGRELEDLITRLGEAKLPVSAVLNVTRLASLIRNAYSPDHPVDAVAGMRRNRAWPHEVDAAAESHLAARTSDGPWWYHATAAVAAWPQTPVGVNFLAPLLVQMPDVLRTGAVVFTLEPNDRALRRLLVEATDDAADAARSAKLGRVADPREVRAEAQSTNRGQELAGGAAGAGLVGYLTVSARSEQELRRLRRDVEAKAGSAFLALEWCDREQPRAFVNTLPFAAGTAA